MRQALLPALLALTIPAAANAESCGELMGTIFAEPKK